MFTKIENFIEYISKKLREHNPDLASRPGSVIHDSFTLPTAAGMSWTSAILKLMETIQFLDKIPSAKNNDDFKLEIAEALEISIDEVDALLSNAIDKIGSNYGLVRKPAQNAFGLAYFYTSSAPAGDLIIPTGTIIENDQKIQYRTTEEVVLLQDLIESYFDPALNAYAVAVPITALESGIASNVSANSLIYMENPIAGFDGVTNKFDISTGYDAETDEEFINRIKETIRGINLETKAGISNLVLNNTAVRNIFVADAQSKYQWRNNGKGGVVDIYISDTLPVIATETLTYNNLEYVFQNQPVLDILSVYDATTTYVEGTDYRFEKDTNIFYKNSAKSSDKLVWLSGGNHPAGEYTVEYVYNDHIKTVQELLTSDEYRPLMGDITEAVLAREGERVDLDIGFRIILHSGFSKTNVVNAAKIAIQSYINSLNFGASVAQSDIINILEDIEGVNYVQTTPLAFNKSGETGIVDVIETLPYQYPRAGVINIQ